MGLLLSCVPSLSKKHRVSNRPKAQQAELKRRLLASSSYFMNSQDKQKNTRQTKNGREETRDEGLLPSKCNSFPVSRLPTLKKTQSILPHTDIYSSKLSGTLPSDTLQEGRNNQITTTLNNVIPDPSVHRHQQCEFISNSSYNKSMRLMVNTSNNAIPPSVSKYNTDRNKSEFSHLNGILSNKTGYFDPRNKDDKGWKITTIADSEKNNIKTARHISKDGYITVLPLERAPEPSHGSSGHVIIKYPGARLVEEFQEELEDYITDTDDDDEDDSLIEL